MTTNLSASFWIESLQMQAHPEGGYFAESYRSPERIVGEALPDRFGGDRALSTAIYFLIEGHHRSTLHRIAADEIWHFYAGIPLHVYVIDLIGALHVIKLGPDALAGEVFQAVVPAGCWFGAKPTQATGYSLVGCTVAPGFDFADFELANANDLLRQYPQHQAVIELLCD